ncbi:hypothetical protein B0H67DRAFT_222947 [Lasiosphaeris hirsuta]|uniref:Uncharacterized protein n=1 Tax=Lasiosphaeris hirsuta TaxID=260670 RepID=A0AA40AFD9_9PEZI|nr:hypothetical protein B0H67DRAFT_222947 [Lasiosphaeris hirsuta]
MGEYNTQENASPLSHRPGTQLAAQGYRGCSAPGHSGDTRLCERTETPAIRCDVMRWEIRGLDDTWKLVGIVRGTWGILARLPTSWWNRTTTRLRRQTALRRHANFQHVALASELDSFFFLFSLFFFFFLSMADRRSMGVMGDGHRLLTDASLGSGQSSIEMRCHIVLLFLAFLTFFKVGCEGARGAPRAMWTSVDNNSKPIIVTLTPNAASRPTKQPESSIGTGSSGGRNGLGHAGSIRRERHAAAYLFPHVHTGYITHISAH